MLNDFSVTLFQNGIETGHISTISYSHLDNSVFDQTKIVFFSLFYYISDVLSIAMKFYDTQCKENSTLNGTS